MRGVTGLAAAAAAAGALLLGVPAVQAAARPPASAAAQAGPVLPGASSAQRDDFWTGYVAEARNNKGSRYVTATFTVPALDCAAVPDGRVTHFVGLGGFTDGYLHAAGISEWCYGSGNPVYQADIWLPGYGPGTVIAPSAGDSITASVYYEKRAGEDKLQIVDNTTTQSWYGMYPCRFTGCGIATSEVITEGNIAAMPTADFGSIGFTNIEMTPVGFTSLGGGVTPARWNITRLVQYGTATRAADVQPGTLSSTPQSSAFTSTWLRPD